MTTLNPYQREWDEFWKLSKQVRTLHYELLDAEHFLRRARDNDVKPYESMMKVVREKLKDIRDIAEC